MRCLFFIPTIALILSIQPASAQVPARPEPPASRSIDGPAPPLAPEVIVRGSDGRVTVRAVRLREPLVLDGLLDEDVYTSVPAISGFLQQEPRQGEPATDQTEAWISFDDENVYVSLRCWSTDPDSIVANEMRRDDNNIWWNENVGVSIDTFYDRRSGVFFQTNAIGGVRDGAANDERNPNFDYNSVWDVKSRRFDKGWTTEMMIPFKSLRYRNGREQVWGLILQRVVRSKNELSYLVPMPASYGGQAIFMYSAAATLVGIEAPPVSTNLDIKPYVISDVTTNRAANPGISNDASADVGLDVKYGVTKGLTLDATYNTDFAQVEADDQQVNLTRFNLFFPERREFFLEGQGIFAFGGIDTRPNAGPSDIPIMFFSRRIGLDDGRAVPIEAGGRLTGRAGRYTVGFLNIQTGESSSGGSSGSNFAVVRVKRDILRRSSIGVIATRRGPAGPAGSNLAVGVDSALQFFQNIQINSYYARTQTSGTTGDDESYRGYFRYGADRYGAEFEHLKVGDVFNPDIGFLRRRDFRRSYGLLRFSPRPRSIRGVRKVSYEAAYDHVVDGTGRLESRIAQGIFRTNFDGGDNADVTYSRTYDYLDVPFQVARSVALPVGGYSFQDVRASYQLGPQRPLTGTFTANRGGFYGGHRTELGYNGRVGLTSRVVMEPRVSMNWVRLPRGKFTARLASTRTSFAITPRAYVSALVQYNSSTDTLATNVRFRWEYQPGSDFFVVYSDGRDTFGPQSPELISRTFVVKLTRLFRF